LGGMSHGIQGLVNEDQMLIRVSLTVSTGGSAATYDPRLLQVYGAGPVGVAPLGGSLGRGRLSPHGRLEGSLSYVVPRDGAQLVLRSEGTSDAAPLLPAGYQLRSLVLGGAALQLTTVTALLNDASTLVVVLLPASALALVPPLRQPARFRTPGRTVLVAGLAIATAAATGTLAPATASP